MGQLLWFIIDTFTFLFVVALGLVLIKLGEDPNYRLNSWQRKQEKREEYVRWLEEMEERKKGIPREKVEKMKREKERLERLKNK